MISVLSRQLRLSGSKGILFLALIVALASCGSSKQSISKSRSSNKVKKTKSTKKTRKNTRTKRDTVQWKEVDTRLKKKKSKLDKPDFSSGKKDHYEVALMIPLDSKSAKGNKRMINYYAGVKMALDQLDQEGANLTLHTVDASTMGSVTSRLRDLKRNDVDVIIGPYSKKDLKTAADFAKSEQITMVSPWIALSSKTIKSNPYYVQMRPSQLDHYEAMIADISDKYKPSQVVLLGQEMNSTDRKRSKYLQKLARAYYKSSDRKPLKEYYIRKDSLMESRMLYIDYLQPKETTVFVIPQTNSRDEDFVYGAIRRLTAEKGESNVIVYGMPIVMDSDRITFDNYHGTNAHVVTSSFIDSEEQKNKDFKSKYFARYGAVPREEAYEGYDMMLYVGRALMKHGSNFQHRMSKPYDDLLQTTISLNPKHKGGSESIGKNIDFFMNTHIDVVKFEDSRFVRD